MKYAAIVLPGALCAMFVAGSVVADTSDISVKPIGRATFNWSSGSNTNDAISFDELEFDVIDVGAKVSFGKRFNVKVHAAVNEDDVKFKDVYLEVPIGKVRYTLGHSKVPNFFNWHISGTSKNFMERPSLRRAFGAARKVGLRAASNGDDWGWSAGVFKGDINETIGASDWTLAARGYLGLSSGDINWFLGASARYRAQEPSAISYGDKPYTFAVGKQFKYLGGTSDILAAGEIAFQRGAFYGVTELAFLRAQSAISANQKDTLSGAYIELGYNITGEETKFDFKRGAFGKARVSNPVSAGGMGLWQISARYDVLDTSAGSSVLNALNGGLQKSFVFGLNWQPTKHVRLLANYSRASISHVLADNDRIDAFGMRFFFML